MTPTVPEGIQVKALRLGLSVSVKSRSIVIGPSLYQFSKQGRAVTPWLTLAWSHNWLDLLASSRAAKGDRT